MHLDPSYCGSCYGANPPSNAMKPGCCNTCDEVKEAYAQQAWAFGRGDGIEQCERENYGQRLDEQRHEGCRIEGGLRVNKVVGNFHIAPGKSFSNGNMHVHDLKNYWDTPVKHTFTHIIHHLRFGPQLPENLHQKLGKKNMPWTNHHLNPLDGTSQETDDVNYNYMYFIKIVPTSYLPLGWEKTWAGFREEHHAELGSFGASADGTVETHQYSVTSHKRSLSGGNDAAEGHQERIHSKGGIPGVFFSYVSLGQPTNQIPSPLVLVRKERRGHGLCLLTRCRSVAPGHLAHEGYQSGGERKDVPGLRRRPVRRRGRHPDGRRRDRPRPVRGHHPSQEAEVQGSLTGPGGAWPCTYLVCGVCCLLFFLFAVLSLSSCD